MSVDDELRRRLQAAADRAGAGAPESLTESVNRGRPRVRRGGMSAMSSTGWFGLLGAVGLVAAGGAAGVVLQRSGAVDPLDEETQVAAYAEASYYDCPSGESLGSFVRGDRVYLVGRDESGGWVQVRSPRDVDQRVWISAAQVSPDAVVDLPVETCALEVTSGTVVDSTAVTGTTEVTDTSTTTPSGPAGPSVGSVNAGPGTIWEGYAADASTCQGNPGQPIRSTVTATINAPGGVKSVVMSWSVGSVSGSTAMSLSGGSYRATLGKFSADDPSPVPNGQTSPITVTVKVTDNQGRTATGGTTVTLKDCTFG